MSRGINKVILIGNLGQDPEVRHTTDDNSVATITVATNEQWKDKNTGEQVTKTEWHRVVFFRRLAEIVGEYLKKGSPVYIEGKLQTRKWQDKEGKDRYTTEIVANEMQMLGGGQPQQDAHNQAKSNGYQQEAPVSNVPTDAAPDFDDDIPF